MKSLANKGKQVENYIAESLLTLGRLDAERER